MSFLRIMTHPKGEFLTNMTQGFPRIMTQSGAGFLRTMTPRFSQS